VNLPNLRRYGAKSKASNTYPKKYSGAKKILRLSPPHRVQSPEVPFLLKQGREKAKATPISNGCVALRYYSGDCID